MYERSVFEAASVSYTKGFNAPVEVIVWGAFFLRLARHIDHTPLLGLFSECLHRASRFVCGLQTSLLQDLSEIYAQLFGGYDRGLVECLQRACEVDFHNLGMLLVSALKLEPDYLLLGV